MVDPTRTQSSILEDQPPYVPTGVIRDEATLTFDDADSNPQTVYPIPKAPYDRLIEVTATVSGIERSLTIGTDVSPVDTIGDSEFDSIEFDTSNRTPDPGTDFEVTYDVRPVIERFIESFDEETGLVDDRLDEAIRGKYVDTATGQSLDLLGAQFGPIGRRRGRTDREYRSFLRSLVRAFNATGTKPDIKFAVAAAIRGDPKNVTVQENTDQVQIGVSVVADSDILVSPALSELIQIAKASGVRLDRVTVVTGDESIETDIMSDVLNRRFGLGISWLGEQTLGDLYGVPPEWYEDEYLSSYELVFDMALEPHSDTPDRGGDGNNSSYELTFNMPF